SWEPIEAKRLHIDVGKRESIEVNRYGLQKGSDAMMVLYWYQSQGRSMAGELSAKLELVRNSMIDNRSDGAIVRISSPVYGSIAQTSELLGEYAKSLYPVLGEFLPGYSDAFHAIANHTPADDHLDPECIPPVQLLALRDP